MSSNLVTSLTIFILLFTVMPLAIGPIRLILWIWFRKKEDTRSYVARITNRIAILYLAFAGAFVILGYFDVSQKIASFLFIRR